MGNTHSSYSFLAFCNEIMKSGIPIPVKALTPHAYPPIIYIIYIYLSIKIIEHQTQRPGQGSSIIILFINGFFELIKIGHPFDSKLMGENVNLVKCEQERQSSLIHNAQGI